MPIYEYRCEACGAVTSVLLLRSDEAHEPVCRICRSSEMTRILSRIVRALSDDQRLEKLADPSSLAGLDEKDPRSVARWLKKMGSAMGEDAGGDVDAMVQEAMESGEVGRNGSE